MEQDIHIATIHLDRATLRHSIPEDSIKQLADSIKQQGLLQAIVVAPREGGGYRLIAGRRRLEACKLLGYITIPARIIEPQDIDEIPALTENLMRLQMNPLEEADAVAYLYETKGLTIREIAERTNHGTSWVQDRLAIRNMPEHFREAIAERKISIAAAQQLLLITDEAYRDYLLSVAKINGATIHQCQAWYQEWQARQMLTNPAGQAEPIPQLPPRPSLYTPQCAFCDQPLPHGPQVILRLCAPCGAELQAAKQAAPDAAAQPAAPKPTDPST